MENNHITCTFICHSIVMEVHFLICMVIFNPIHIFYETTESRWFNQNKIVIHIGR